MKNLLKKLARRLLADEINKILEEKLIAEESIVRVQNTLGTIADFAEKKVQKLEGFIVNQQEKQQRLFYEEEKNLLNLLSTGVIDPKEHYYAQQFLKKIEKELDVIQAAPVVETQKDSDMAAEQE